MHPAPILHWPLGGTPCRYQIFALVAVLFFAVLIVHLSPCSAEEASMGSNVSTDSPSNTSNKQTVEIFADQFTYDQNGQRICASGNVKVISGEDILTGESLTLDMETETGSLVNGRVFLHENHLYLSAGEIQKTGADTYTADSATLTACDGPNPDWRITGKAIRITIEGYGFAKHATLWAKQAPLLYTPFWVFPVKTKRQTGFLMPELTYSANRKGLNYRQPFFWALSDSSDMTLYADLMTLRGVKPGAEFRYMASSSSLGTIMLDGFNDAKVDDGSEANSDDYGYNDDDYIRPNPDRYWLRGKVDQDLPGDFKAKLDIDLVSDQDYLLEFRDGVNGFDQSRNYFRKTYGRDIDDEYTAARMNRLNLNKTWRHAALNGDFRWYEDVIERRFEDTVDTVQHLPSILFDAIEQPIAGSPLYFSLDAGYDFLYREDDADGHRADLYAALYYPMRWFENISITSATGLRQTVWMTEDDAFKTDHDQESAYRYLFDFNLDINTEPFRIYQSGFGGGDRLKHIFKPQLTYTFRSDTDENTTAYFDDLDQIDRENKVTFALTNTFITRKAIPSAVQKYQAYDYHSFLRFKILESFDIHKFNDNDPRPFSDILGELELMPAKALSLTADAAWSPYDADLNRVTTGVHFWDKRDDRLNLNYTFTRGTDQIEGTSNINISTVLKVTDSWQLRAAHERNLETDASVKSSLGFSYLSQCWSLMVDYSEESDDWNISATIHLTGLGGIGN